MIYLTQWVSIWQFLIGFMYIPFLGELGQVTTNFYNGLRCWLQIDHSCSADQTFWLLTGYTINNFVFNLFGLYLTKHSSAVLNTVAFAAIIPLTAVTFSLPFLGRYREDLQFSTVIGLVFVFFGFYIYQSHAARAKAETLSKEAPAEQQDAFQERIIGIDAVANASSIM